MKRAALILAAATAAATAAACTQDTTPVQPPAEQAPQLAATKDEVRGYLRLLASRLARRPLIPEESAQVEQSGADAIAPIVQAWLRDPAFVVAARDMVEHLLKTSGQLGEIDYDLPGNLAAHLVKHELPYSKLLTADFCVGKDDERIECDTSAPYTAGVLTTRAYLAANASRFNLRRSTTLMRVFACKGYPMSPELQPSEKKDDLIPMFRALTPEEQTVEEAQSGFGNGFGCYTCHSQFAAHAQLYVKFDSTGLWRDYAHGIQNESGELGRSIGRFFASHFVKVERSQDERSQIFGQPVANLSDAAKVIASDSGFVPCAARRAFEYAFDLDETVSGRTDPALYQRLADELKDAGHADPTFSQLFSVVVTNPVIIRAVMDQR